MSSKHVVLVAAALLAACWTPRQREIVSSGEVSATTIDAERGGALPSGSNLSVSIDSSLSTADVEVGDRVTATFKNGVIARNGDVIIPTGARVYGKITGVDNPDRATGRALIQLDFDALEFFGKRYPFEANVTDVSNVVKRSRTTGEVIATAPAGSAHAAAIITGPELDAIVASGRFNARAGTVISLGHGDMVHVIPAGTPMMLRTTQTVTLK